MTAAATVQEIRAADSVLLRVQMEIPAAEAGSAEAATVFNPVTETAPKVETAVVAETVRAVIRAVLKAATGRKIHNANGE